MLTAAGKRRRKIHIYIEKSHTLYFVTVSWSTVMLCCGFPSEKSTPSTNIPTHSHVWSHNKVTTATERCQTLFTAVLCNLQRHWIFQGVVIVFASEVKRWIHAVALVWTNASMPQTWCHRTSGEIIIVPGNTEWCRETGARQMWGLARNFICHCTLQQTSLLIRSPWTGLGIWTVCSWTDWMMSFCAPIATSAHTCTQTHTSTSKLQTCLSYITPRTCR